MANFSSTTTRTTSSRLTTSTTGADKLRATFAISQDTRQIHIGQTRESVRQIRQNPASYDTTNVTTSNAITSGPFAIASCVLHCRLRGSGLRTTTFTDNHYDAPQKSHTERCPGTVNFRHLGNVLGLFGLVNTFLALYTFYLVANVDVLTFTGLRPCSECTGRDE